MSLYRLKCVVFIREDEAGNMWEDMNEDASPTTSRVCAKNVVFAWPEFGCWSKFWSAWILSNCYLIV